MILIMVREIVLMALLMTVLVMVIAAQSLGLVMVLQTVKVSNMTDKEATGKVRLTFADALTNDSVDDQLGNADLDQKFTVPAKQSKTYSWRINVPDDLGFLTYKAVGGTDTVTDGEQGFLPVLSRRIFVTESLPLPIRGPKAKTFNFDKLIASGGSDTIKHERYTVQMVSNPNWYAVMALPYLMESPHPSTMSTSVSRIIFTAPHFCMGMPQSNLPKAPPNKVSENSHPISPCSTPALISVKPRKATTPLRMAVSTKPTIE